MGGGGLALYLLFGWPCELVGADASLEWMPVYSGCLGDLPYHALALQKGKPIVSAYPTITRRFVVMLV